MKNCTCKEQLVSRTCDEPIIKLFIDDCTGCPVYPTTSTEAVLTNCGHKTLELELADIIETIQLISNDLNNKVLNEESVISLKYKINSLESLTSDLPELRSALLELLSEVERLLCIYSAVNNLDLTSLKNDFNDYIERLNRNELLLTRLLGSITDPFGDINIDFGITLELLEERLNTYSAEIAANYVRKDENGLPETDGITTLYFNGRLTRIGHNNEIVGSGTYAIHTNYNSILYKDDNNQWQCSNWCRFGGSYGGWITNYALSEALSQHIVKVNIDGNTYTWNGSLSKYICGDNSMTESDMTSYFTTMYNNLRNKAVSHDSNVTNANCYIWHFYVDSTNKVINISRFDLSAIKIPADYELHYDLSHQAIGYIRANNFIGFKYDGSIFRATLEECLSIYPVSLDSQSILKVVIEPDKVTPTENPNTGNLFKLKYTSLDISASINYEYDGLETVNVPNDAAPGSVSWTLDNNATGKLQITSSDNKHVVLKVIDYTSSPIVVTATYDGIFQSCTINLSYSKYDLNRDGIVDVTDVDILIDEVLGKTSSLAPGANPNLNDDNITDVSDVDIMIDAVLGKISYNLINN